MSSNQREEFIDILAKFTSLSGVNLPDDVLQKLKELESKETVPMANVVYKAMFDDLKLADDLRRPICQDTGVIQYYVQVGTKFPLIDEVETCLREAAVRASAETPLRPNVVEIFDEKNTGNNVGFRIPWIEWEIVPHRDDIQVYVYMAGGGCSLPGAAKVFPPLVGYDGAVEFILEQVSTLGVNACPPLLVGVGIGGSVDVAAKLSKKALMRPIGSHNPNARGAELEKKLEEALNKIQIGPGGFTGSASVMGVNIEHAGRHPATVATGVSVGCWAHRRAVIKIGADMSYEMISHKGVRL
ncbi:MAG: L(+)-tartrate dehydratase subunit alpha [Saezia sp.]